MSPLTHAHGTCGAGRDCAQQRCMNTGPFVCEVIFCPSRVGRVEAQPIGAAFLMQLYCFVARRHVCCTQPCMQTRIGHGDGINAALCAEASGGWCLSQIYSHDRAEVNTKQISKKTTWCLQTPMYKHTHQYPITQQHRGKAPPPRQLFIGCR